MKNAALLMVDCQKDFFPGGTLGVAHGDEVIAPLIHLAKCGDFDFICASQDYHPKNHCSFVENRGPWPTHCVVGTAGAEVDPGILEVASVVVRKGGDASKEQYSALDGTGLTEELRNRDIEIVVIGGLATDYCVKETVLDCLKAGFRVMILIDAVRAVDKEKGDGEKVIMELVTAGAHTMMSTTLLEKYFRGRD